MSTFKGSEFLKSKTVNVELSNGKQFAVNEISQEAMDKLQKMEEGGASMAAQLALICNVDEEVFAGLGIVELRGVFDFLFENLFTSK